MKFGGEYIKYNDVGFVEKLKIFDTQDASFYGTELFEV